MNAINRAGINSFLDAFGAITVLPNGPGTPQMGLNNKGIAGHMSAVTAPDADGLIDPNRSFPQCPSEKRFTPRWFVRTLRVDLEGKGWIGRGVVRQIQASQRVTTSSIEPSCAIRCSDT